MTYLLVRYLLPFAVGVFLILGAISFVVLNWEWFAGGLVVLLVLASVTVNYRKKNQNVRL